VLVGEVGGGQPPDAPRSIQAWEGEGKRDGEKEEETLVIKRRNDSLVKRRRKNQPDARRRR